MTWKFFDIANYFSDVLSRLFWKNATEDSQVKFLTQIEKIWFRFRKQQQGQMRFPQTNY